MEKEIGEAHDMARGILGVLEEDKDIGEASKRLEKLVDLLGCCLEKSRNVVTLPLKKKSIQDYLDATYQQSQKTKITAVRKSNDDGGISRFSSLDEANYFVRRQNGHLANQFWWGGCTFHNVLKTCIQGPGRVYPCHDNSFGISWVAVQAKDGSIAVVTRQCDLDITQVNSFYKTQPRDRILAALHQALTSEVECLPYDDDHFLKGPSKSIKKPFSVGRLIGETITKPLSAVSLYPIPKNSDQDAGQLASSAEYNGDKAINFLMGKMNSELVATLDDAIKIAISGFMHLCRKDLKAEEYWVSKWDCGKNLLQHLPSPQIEKYLEVISGEMN